MMSNLRQYIKQTKDDDSQQQGSKKTLWFTYEQLVNLDKIKELTDLNNSEAVRLGLELLLKELQK